MRHLDGKLPWIQNRKGFKMVQVPTGGNMADINTKPLGGQRIRYFTNPFGYWHSEDQVRVGECALPKKIVRIESEWLLLRACSQWLQKHP